MNNMMEGDGVQNSGILKKNHSIICSFLIKQKFPTQKIGLHSILIPVGIIKGIKKNIDENLSIKWPNDIIFENKKLGGILIETKTFNNSIYLNVGIGINVNEKITDFPEEIKQSATSLKIISKQDIQREILLANILNLIYNCYLFISNILFLAYGS